MEQWNRKWRTLWCWSNVYVGWKVSQARARALPKEEQAEFWEQRHEHFANVIWENIKELRGWWVKVGQFMSTRSDLLPQQYIHHLVKLQDMMPTSDFASIRQTIADELGDVDEIFERIDPVALASASIGQVHRAWLKDGSPVVVKVQHADVETLLSHDMQNLKQLSWAFGLLESGLNFAPILEEWQKAAAKELDFRYELAHQLRAYEGLRKSGIDVKIPKPYPEFTAKKVMVMEFVNGFKITDTEKLDAHNVDRRELMFKLCDSFAYQIHIDGLFNGDPHPGNILVEVDAATGEATPIILDWGLVKEFDAKGQLAFAKLVYAVASMNVMGLMEAFEDMGFKFKEGAGAVIDPEVYMDALRIALRDGEVEKEETEALKKSAGETLGAAQKAGLNRQKLQEKNPLEDWPRDIIFFVRVASLLHGLCVQLNVHLPFLQIMVKRAQECLFERYVPPSPLIYVKRLGSQNTARPRTELEGRVHRLLRSLFQRGLVLGCQVAVVKDGALLVDACIGKMGPVDARPVTSDSLFCGYCVSKGILTTALLKLVSDGEVQLDDLVSNWWDGFIRYGKKNITIRQLLSHRAGLHRALPVNLTLSKLTDYAAMIGVIEDAAPATVPGLVGRYAYLTYGWAVSELVASVACTPVEDFILDKMLRPFGLENSIFLPVPEDGLFGEKLEDSDTRNTAPKADDAKTLTPAGAESAARPSSRGAQHEAPKNPEKEQGGGGSLSAASAVSAFSSFTKSLASGQQLLTERLGQRFLRREDSSASGARSLDGERKGGDEGGSEPQAGTAEGDAKQREQGGAADSREMTVQGPRLESPRPRPLRPSACCQDGDASEVCASAPSPPGDGAAGGAADDGLFPAARSAPLSAYGSPLGSPCAQSVTLEGGRDFEELAVPKREQPRDSSPAASLFSRRVSALASSFRSLLRSRRPGSTEQPGKSLSCDEGEAKRGVGCDEKVEKKSEQTVGGASAKWCTDRSHTSEKAGWARATGLRDRATSGKSRSFFFKAKSEKQGRGLSVILHAPESPASPDDAEAGSVLLYHGDPGGASREGSLSGEHDVQAPLTDSRKGDEGALKRYRRGTSACTLDSSVASTATKAGILEDESDRRSAYYSVSSEDCESCCCTSSRRPSSDSRADVLCTERPGDESASGNNASTSSLHAEFSSQRAEAKGNEVSHCGEVLDARLEFSSVDSEGKSKASDPAGGATGGGSPCLGPSASDSAASTSTGKQMPACKTQDIPSTSSPFSEELSSSLPSSLRSSASLLSTQRVSAEGLSKEDTLETRARFPPSVCTVTAKTPLFWRITSARRRISFGNVTQQEVMEKLQAAKKYAEAQFGDKDAEEQKELATNRARQRQRLHKERALRKLRRARPAGAGGEVWRREAEGRGGEPVSSEAARASDAEQMARNSRRRSGGRRRHDDSSGMGRAESGNRLERQRRRSSGEVDSDGVSPRERLGGEELVLRRRRGDEKISGEGRESRRDLQRARPSDRRESQRHSPSLNDSKMRNEGRQQSLLSPATALSVLSSRVSSRRGSSSGRSSGSRDDDFPHLPFGDSLLLSSRSPSLSGEEKAAAGALDSGLRAPQPAAAPVSLSPQVQGEAPVPRVSALDLIRKKPHVMDPLLYDSRRILCKRVPPTNGRFTACGLARLYAAIAAGELLDGPTLEAARTPATVDDSLETLLLTGGGSRVWGLGYQLYECSKVDANHLALPPPPSPGSLMRLRAAQSFSRRQSLHPSSAVAAARFLRCQYSGEAPAGGVSPVAAGFAGASSTAPTVGHSSSLGIQPPQEVGRDAHAEGGVVGARSPRAGGVGRPRMLSPCRRDDRRTVTGFGHGDFGGSVALCFPELNLSIAILVNDVLTGPQASREILEFLLRKFGLEPRWTTAVDFEEVLANLTPKPERSK
ncbi:ABC1 family protein [Toxoplasma gondii ARI]|uniref:ABC1 family protein n=1 Tax=Toxoplasma gondii ARI TaxID=1074872 RepID=A0A139YA69_TOXGO|nr:ABC1 family protein [Toxoplasma gondii ARI]